MASLDAVLDLPVCSYPVEYDEHSREQALKRLYARRLAVDELIDSLERYQLARALEANNCVSIDLGRRS